MQFSLYSSPISLVSREQVSSRDFVGFLPSGALNVGWVGKIDDFQPLFKPPYLQNVQNMTKVVTDH